MTAEPDRQLADFLRAQRARVTPAQVGLVGGTGRRVEGLRREEVAALAGLSVDYYVRLEQGRERRPSLQVVNALARLFRLERDARLHLARLARLIPPVDLGKRHDEASPELLALLDAWPTTPAIVFNHAYDPLAQNGLGAALFGPFEGANLALSVFLDPGARDFYLDWPAAARETAGALRHSTGKVPDDGRLGEVIATLLEASPDFRDLWAASYVTGKTRADKHLAHPSVGVLHLTMQTFEVRDAPGQELIVYLAEAGSPSEDALRLLESLALTAD